MDIQVMKKYMKMNKITYEELARRTNLSISTITKIFGGYAKYPRVDTIVAIENALGMSEKNDVRIVENVFEKLTDFQKTLLEVVDSLSREDQYQVLGFAQALAR